MGYDLTEAEFPRVAAGFCPAVASPSVVGVNLLGIASVIHPIVGLWEVTLSNGVGAGQYLFQANANGVSVGQLTICIQDVSATVKDITLFNIGAAQDFAFTWNIRRILR